MVTVSYGAGSNVTTGFNQSLLISKEDTVTK
jgi:hypothetical protein